MKRLLTIVALPACVAAAWAVLRTSIQWNSLEHVTTVSAYLTVAGIVLLALLVMFELLALFVRAEPHHTRFEVLGVVCLGLFVVSDIANYWYDHRKDELLNAQFEAKIAERDEKLAILEGRRDEIESLLASAEYSLAKGAQVPRSAYAPNHLHLRTKAGKAFTFSTAGGWGQAGSDGPIWFTYHSPPELAEAPLSVLAEIDSLSWNIRPIWPTRPGGPPVTEAGVRLSIHVNGFDRLVAVTIPESASSSGDPLTLQVGDHFRAIEEKYAKRIDERRRKLLQPGH